MLLLKLYTTEVNNASGEGLEQLIFNWEAIQQFLYKKGITRDRDLNVIQSEKSLKISVFEHYNLQPQTSNVKYNSFNPPTVQTLKNTYVYWEDKPLDIVELEDTTIPTLSIQNCGIYSISKTCGNLIGCDVLSFVKSGNTISYLPIAAKFSLGSSAKFDISTVKGKLKTCTKHFKEFPFIIFIVQREIQVPRKAKG